MPTCSVRILHIITLTDKRKLNRIAALNTIIMFPIPHYVGDYNMVFVYVIVNPIPMAYAGLLYSAELVGRHLPSVQMIHCATTFAHSLYYTITMAVFYLYIHYSYTFLMILHDMRCSDVIWHRTTTLKKVLAMDTIVPVKRK